MALINCPECGQQISSTVKTCIHCGCKVTICPECANRYVGEIEMCTNCGYMFQKEKLNNKTEIETENKGESITEEKVDVIKVYQKWRQDNFVNKYLFIPMANSKKVNPLIQIIIIILGELFMAICGIKLVLWITGDPITGIANYGKVLEECKSLLIISGIVMSCVGLIPILQLCGVFSFKKHAELNNYDIQGSLINYFKTDMKKKSAACLIEEKPMIETAIYGKILEKSVLEKEKSRNSLIAPIGLFIVSVFLLLAFLINLLETVMEHYLYNQTMIEFSQITGIWIFIVGFIVAIASDVMLKKRKKNIDLQINKWAKENLGNDYDSFKKLADLKK